MRRDVGSAVLSAIVLVTALSQLTAQVKPTWSADEQPIFDKMRGLRQVPDDARGGVTRELAVQIRKLPITPNKLRLAVGLAHLSTEGDFGQQTLREVATTLADALREQPAPDVKGDPAMAYVTLAQLARYEHVPVSLDAAPFAAAMAKLEAEDQRRASADFALQDLNGKQWKLSSLRGRVVLVNFWATWCPPCRKEMPDLDSLYSRFRKKGLVVLAISDEGADKVSPFLKEHKVAYPVLLDTDRAVSKLY